MAFGVSQAIFVETVKAGSASLLQFTVQPSLLKQGIAPFKIASTSEISSTLVASISTSVVLRTHAQLGLSDGLILTDNA